MIQLQKIGTLLLAGAPFIHEFSKQKVGIEHSNVNCHILELSYLVYISIKGVRKQQRDFCFVVGISNVLQDIYVIGLKSLRVLSSTGGPPTNLEDRSSTVSLRATKSCEA